MRIISLTLLLCSKVFGAPPQVSKPSIADLATVSKEGRLDEIIPVIDDISFKTSPTTLEVFIAAWAFTDCYDKVENVVELKKNYTQIIPRRSRSNPNQSCRLKLKRINEKIAELDITDPSSSEIRILGFRGWHVRKIETPTLVKVENPTNPPAISSSAGSSP